MRKFRKIQRRGSWGNDSTRGTKVFIAFDTLIAALTSQDRSS